MSKRGVFFTALGNMEDYGKYFRPKLMLAAEFQDMGISLESQNIVNEYTQN